MLTAEEVIEKLKLLPHPVEGGHFRETYRSAINLPQAALPGHPGERHLNTAIYYLLTGTAVSEMHLLPGDEIYHFYAGDPLETLLLNPDGSSERIILGNDLANGQVPQLVIRGGVWQGSIRQPGPLGFTLIGATMAPGFDYRDYVQGTRAELIARWPTCSELILARTPRG